MYFDVSLAGAVGASTTQWALERLMSLAATFTKDACPLDASVFTERQLDELAATALVCQESDDERLRVVAFKLIFFSPQVAEAIGRLVVPALAHPSAAMRKHAAIVLNWIGEKGRVALDELVRLLNDDDQDVRTVVAGALANMLNSTDGAVSEQISDAIPGSNAAARTLLLHCLTIIGQGSGSLEATLERSLDDPDPQVRVAAATHLHLAKDDPNANVPRLLKTLATDLREDDNLVYSREFVEQQVGDALVPRDDPDLQDFVLLFLRTAFHPGAIERGEWANAVVNHSFVRKILRRRLRHLEAARPEQYPPQVIDDLMDEGKSRLLLRLTKNPTLGLVPDRFLELPGYIRNHLRNIAWRLGQQRQKNDSRSADADIEAVAVTTNEPDRVVDQDLLGELWDFVTTKLSEEEAYVALCRWRLGWSLNETASALGLSKSQVMTREKNARAALRGQFGKDES